VRMRALESTLEEVRHIDPKGASMKRIIGSVVIVFSLAFVGAATAGSSSSETITTVLSFPAFPATAPFVGTYSGTFMASGTVTDSGTVTAEAVFGAAPAPHTGVLQTNRTLSSNDGTLQLRCTQIAKSFSNLSAVPNTGTCAVLSATGVYAGLRGAGKLTGEVNFNASPFPTLTDTLVL
jgi:hypothetical protein